MAVRDWRSLVRADPVSWLLSFDEPALRYQVLTDLLDKPSDHRDVVMAREEKMHRGLIPSILSKQSGPGYWGRPEDFYVRSKYHGTVWNTILLAELGAEAADPRLSNVIDFLYQWSRREDGGFSDGKNKAGHMKSGMPCLTANMVWAFCRFGAASDPRLDKPVELLIQPLEEWQESRLGTRCVRCRTGWVKALKALNALPPSRRSQEVRERSDELAEAIIEHVLPRTIEPTPPYRPEWSDLSFPLMWNTDLVEMLDVLAGQGRWDERMRLALDVIQAKQDHQGRWNLDRSWNGRMAVRIDKVGKVSPWVTLKALAMLKRLPD